MSRQVGDLVQTSNLLVEAAFVRSVLAAKDDKDRFVEPRRLGASGRVIRQPLRLVFRGFG